MENLEFKFSDGQGARTFPSNFILPDDEKPHLSEVFPLTTIPIIDMKIEDHSSLVNQISNACEEYGFFQIINHGVSDELCKSMMEAFTQFFHDVPPEERAKLLTEDKLNSSGKIYRHSLFVKDRNEKALLWNETLTHPPYPSDDFADQLPNYPPQYREIVSKYMEEVRGVFPRLLRLLSEGLGLDENRILEKIGYKNGKVHVLMHAHYSPACPDPGSTLASMNHTDIDAITVIQQKEDVIGFHVKKDDKWFSVKPVKNSFLVVLGDQIQVMSNGKYKSRYHRTVANKDKYRTSLAIFCAPHSSAKIGPIEELINQENPPQYKSFFYPDVLAEFRKKDRKAIKMEEFFKI